MQTAAEIVTYLQPISAECEIGAFVDTNSTTVLRRIVRNRDEALAALSEAKAVAAAIGSDCGMKTVVNKPWGMPATRMPAKVRCLAGSCIVRKS